MSAVALPMREGDQSIARLHAGLWGIVLGFDLSGAVCAGEEFASGRRVNYWEAAVDALPSSRELYRTRAEQLCRACPVLALCEERLQIFEAAGQEVHGVVAGRLFHPQKVKAKRYCRQCGAVVVSRPKKKDFSGVRWHAGKGLCNRCYERARREGRK